jgi:hypothetical protein
MLRESTSGRLLTALRLAFYPAFESAEARRFQALTMEAENARGSGDLAKAEKVYSTAAAEARSSSDPLHLSRARDGLARVYQEQRRYREAERIFQDQLEAAVNSPQPNTLVRSRSSTSCRENTKRRRHYIGVPWKCASSCTGPIACLPRGALMIWRDSAAREAATRRRKGFTGEA